MARIVARSPQQRWARIRQAECLALLGHREGALGLLFAEDGLEPDLVRMQVVPRALCGQADEAYQRLAAVTTGGGTEPDWLWLLRLRLAAAAHDAAGMEALVAQAPAERGGDLGQTIATDPLFDPWRMAPWFVQAFGVTCAGTPPERFQSVLIDAADDARIARLPPVVIDVEGGIAVQRVLDALRAEEWAELRTALAALPAEGQSAAARDLLTAVAAIRSDPVDAAVARAALLRIAFQHWGFAQPQCQAAYAAIDAGFKASDAANVHTSQEERRSWLLALWYALRSRDGEPLAIAQQFETYAEKSAPLPELEQARAQAEWTRGRLAEAIARLRAARTQWPESLATALMLARVLVDDDQVDAAVAELAAARQLGADPSDADAIAMRIRAVREDVAAIEPAVDRLTQACAASDLRPLSVWSHIATLRLVHADAVGAERALRRSLTIAPHGSELRQRLIDVLMRQARWDAALAELETLACLVDDDDGVLAMQRAMIWHHLGRRDEASALATSARQPQDHQQLDAWHLQRARWHAVTGDAAAVEAALRAYGEQEQGVFWRRCLARDPFFAAWREQPWFTELLASP